MPSHLPRVGWRRQARDVFAGPDGSTITIGGQVPTTGSWSCLFKAVVDGRGFGFTIAEAGSFDWFVQHVVVDGQVEETDALGGRVRSVHDAATGEVAIAWTGPWWEIQFGSLGTAPDLALGIEVFTAMGLRDTPDGLVVRTWGQRVVASTLSVFKELGELGDLQIDRPSAVDLPPWKGRSTRGGELWSRAMGSDARGRSRDTLLVLGTSTSVGSLIPGPESTVDESAVVAAMDSLTLQWS